MRAAGTFALAWAAIALICGTVSAQSIGLSLPLSGKFADIGQRMEFGANLAITDAKDSGADVTLTLVDDQCDTERAAEAAKRFVEASVQAVAGPICFDPAQAIAMAMKGRGFDVPVIAWGIRNGLLDRARSYHSLPLYAVGQGGDAEARAFVDLLLPKFGNRPWAIADDGSAHGRSLSDEIRLLGEQQGYRPAALAGFRPLQSNQRAMLRQLQRSGVQALIIAGQPEDVTTITRDAAAIGLDWTFAVGEQARLVRFAENAEGLPDGLMMVRETVPALVGAESLLDTLRSLETVPDRAVLEGYALMQIALAAAGRDSIAMTDEPFDTIFGPVTFGGDGLATALPMRLHEWKADRFVPADVATR